MILRRHEKARPSEGIIPGPGKLVARRVKYLVSLSQVNIGIPFCADASRITHVACLLINVSAAIGL